MTKLLYYRIKILLSNKAIIFWTLCFPMILSCFFNIALKDVYSGTPVSSTSVGVVVSDEKVSDFIDVIEKDHQLVSSVKYDTLDQAMDALRRGDIEAVIDDEGGQVRLTFTKDSYNSQTTILNNVFKSFNMKRALIEEQYVKDPASVTPEFITQITEIGSFVKTQNDEVSEQAYVIHFYTAIAMLCLYASEWGNSSGKYLQADMSAIGIRNNISPTKKYKILLQDLCSVYFIFLLEFTIFMCFLKFVLDVPFGNHLGLIVLTGLMGGLLTSMLGYMICVVLKGSEGLRNSIISGLGVFMSFLSGMMVSGIKYFVDVQFPILSKINPAALITDNFYWILKGTHSEVVYMNLLIMLGMTMVFGVIAYVKMKGVSYDHI